MKRILIVCAIFCITTQLYNPTLSKENTLTIEQMKEINSIGNAVENLISQNDKTKSCFLAYKMIKRYPNEPDSYFAYAKASYHAGYPDRAIEYYKKCLELDKTYYQAYNNIGFIYYQQKNYKEAIKYYSKVIKMTKNNDENSQINALAHSNRALAKYFNGDLKSSLNDYNKSLKNLSSFSGIDHIYYNRGLCRYDLGDKSGAEEDFNTAKKLNPSFRYVYYDKRG